MNEHKENNDNAKKSKVFYKCSVCGFLHDGSEGAPSSCIKCDNNKFYRETH